MEKIKKFLVTTLVLISAFSFQTVVLADPGGTGTGNPVSTSVAATNSATKDAIQNGVNAAAGGSNQNPSSLDSTITTIINLLSAIVGVVAVIMIIIAGLRFTASAGNPEAAKSARSTIMYAVIGLVVVALAQVIVHFVLNKVT